MAKQTGKVKWFNDSRGYGFAETEKHGEVFLHYCSIEGEGYKTLCEGDAITFVLVESPKGPVATNIKKQEDRS